MVAGRLKGVHAAVAKKWRVADRFKGVDAAVAKNGEFAATYLVVTCCLASPPVLLGITTVLSEQLQCFGQSIRMNGFV